MHDEMVDFLKFGHKQNSHCNHMEVAVAALLE